MTHDLGSIDDGESWARPSHAPKQVHALALSSLIFCCILLANGVYLAALRQPLGVISVFGAFVLMLRSIRILSTRITETEVSQLSWRGRLHMPWTEVTQVTRTPLSFTLTGDKRRIVISVEELQDTAAAIAYIESHLPTHLSSNRRAGIS
jgi:hypothetical protein